MLNITAQQNAAGAKAYFAQADYYSQGQEVTGRWYGNAAAKLGLSGIVEQADFHKLCDNVHPETGKQLTVKNLNGRRVGYDFTWSAPKSVSIVQALTGDKQILAAWQESIHATMQEMEQEMATRVRKAGADTDRTTGNWVYAEFIHHTSRPVDGVPAPQLHSHTFIFNATHDPVEDKWKAGQFGQLKQDAYHWQAVQQVRFAEKLQDLGYGIRRTKDAFEIKGVPQTAIEKFSPRTRQIEEAAERLGIVDPKKKAKLAATTREAKNAEVPYDQLIEQWKTWIDAETLASIKQTKHAEPQREAAAASERIQYALDHHLERNSVVDERRVLAQALKETVGRGTVEELRQAWKETDILKKTEVSRTWISTPQVLAEETAMLDIARHGRGVCHPVARLSEIEIKRDLLNHEQRQAIKHVLTSADKIMLLRGSAGTGKTTLTQEAVEQFEQRGKSVVMLAPSAKASRGVLRDEGFEEADTLAKFLQDKDFQAKAKNGIIWLDEASLVGTKSMLKLFRTAESLHARVVCAGDKWQHGSIERSSALPSLETLAGLPVAEVNEIQRQKHKDYKLAVKLLAHGQALQGLEALDKQDRIKLLQPDSYRQVAEDYIAKRERSKDPDKDVMIVCPTHAEAALVTAEIRHTMQEQKLLGTDERYLTQYIPKQWTVAERGNRDQYQGGEVLQFHHNTGPYKAGERITYDASAPLPKQVKPEYFSVYTEDKIGFAPGDQIRLTANGKTLDGLQRINNGDVYTLKAYTKSGDLQFTNGKIVSHDFGHWTHGFVSTSQASQGRTVEHVLLVQSGHSHQASSREGLYVAASRGKSSVTIYTDSKDDLRDAVQRSEAKRSATEVFRPKPTKLKAWQRWRQQLRRSQERAMNAAKHLSRQLEDTLSRHEPVYER